MRSWNVFISFSIASGMVLGTQNHRESWSDLKGKLVVPEQMCAFFLSAFQLGSFYSCLNYLYGPEVVKFHFI